MEYEKILIAMWLKGEYLEYLQDFKESNFKIYPHVFKALKESSDMVKIARLSKESVAALMEIVSNYGFSNAIFPGAYRAMKEHCIREKILELAQNPKNTPQKLEKIMQEIQEIDIGAEEIIPPPSEEYSKVLDLRHQGQKLFYGHQNIDYITGGIRSKELTVIAARPGIGKTAFALQIALNVAQQHKVFFFSLEMARVQLLERIVIKNTGIDGIKLKHPETLKKPDDWDDLANAYLQIPENLRIYQDTKLLEKIKKLIEKHQPALVVIDQLSHIKTREFKTVREKYLHLTNTLKDWTMELDVPIILLAQINRHGQDRLPTLADLKESGSIEEDADNIFILHRMDEDEVDNSGKFGGTYRELVKRNIYPSIIALAKQRNGITQGMRSLYNGKRFCFEEIRSE